VPDIAILIEAARHVTMTPADREAQRRSFAFGNCAIENPLITRELVERVAGRTPIGRTEGHDQELPQPAGPISEPAQETGTKDRSEPGTWTEP
jgi:hypothetical protein